MKNCKSKLNKNNIEKIILILLVTTSIITFSNLLNYDYSNSSTFENYMFPQNSLITSDPIYIDEDQDWIDLKNDGRCTGEGTITNPYILSNLNINAKGGGYGIFLDHQTVYFKIINSNLYNSTGSGIFMYASDYGEILNNNISSNKIGIKIDIPPTPPSYHSNMLISGNYIYNNSEDGIFGLEIYDSEISNNIIMQNGDYGIYFAGHNERVKILNNNISNNYRSGNYLISVNNSEINGNIINYNGNGVTLYSSANNIISDNSINYNKGKKNGITLDASSSNTIENNDITDNEYYELYFDDSSNNIIRNNKLIETFSNFYWLSGASSGNIFENNNVQYDDSYEFNDLFNDAKEISLGDYSNLVALDDDWYKVFIDQSSQYDISLNYLISEDPLDLYLYNSLGLLIDYSDSGLPDRIVSFQATSSDYYYIRVFNGINLNYELSIYYTIIDLPPKIIINSPTMNEVFGSDAPNFDLTINDESPINSGWYSLDGGTINITFSGLSGNIDQTEWDKKDSGTVVIRFFVNDNPGKEGYTEVSVLKEIEKVENENKEQSISGYHLILFISLIGVLTGIYLKKKYKKLLKSNVLK